MHLYPAIDLRDGRVVRLQQGEFARETVFRDDPVEQAREFERLGATHLHMVDLDGARTGKPAHLQIIARVCRETALTVQVGGGVRNEAIVDRLLSSGVKRVVLGTAALRNWAWFESLMGNPTYNQKLVLGLDARDGKLAVEGWQEATDAEAVDVARTVSDWPLAGIVYTDIAVDGMLTGPNLDATRRLAEATAVPVIASGGVGELQHLRDLAPLPLGGVIVGRALYDQRFTLPEALDALRT